jgi:hypothetical protein
MRQALDVMQLNSVRGAARARSKKVVSDSCITMVEPSATTAAMPLG